MDVTDPDFVVFVTWDGTQYRMPKQFTISIETNISMAVSSVKELSYTVYGADYSDVKVAFITQGGFEAYLSETPGVVVIKSPADFIPEQGRIMAIFTINNSQRSSVKIITINKL